jgi:hypothetical protein
MKRVNRLTRHHIIPTSRAGKDTENNISYVPQRQHEKYHELFGNRKPEEIIDYLVNDFWNERKDFIDKYQEKYKNI